MTDGGHQGTSSSSYGHLRPLGLRRLVNTGSLLTVRASLLAAPRFVFSFTDSLLHRSKDSVCRFLFQEKEMEEEELF